MPYGAVTESCRIHVLQGTKECKEDIEMSFCHNIGRCVWHAEQQDGNYVDQKSLVR